MPALPEPTDYNESALFTREDMLAYARAHAAAVAAPLVEAIERSIKNYPADDAACPTHVAILRAALKAHREQQ